MHNIAVVLSGCGVYDGSEIYETVFTLLALQSAGVKYQCLAPNIEQHHVINHITGNEMSEKRNVLLEAARLARGEIKDLNAVNADDYTAAIFPGGFGAAKNLCDFAFKQDKHSVNKIVFAFAEKFMQAKKWVGFICIAPTLIPKIYPKGAKLTIGNDESVANAIVKMGGSHISCQVDDIVVDDNNKIVTTPAYMLAENMLQAKAGIDKLVAKILQQR